MKDLTKPFSKLQFMTNRILVSTRRCVIWNLYGELWTSLEKKNRFLPLNEYIVTPKNQNFKGNKTKRQKF